MRSRNSSGLIVAAHILLANAAASQATSSTPAKTVADTSIVLSGVLFANFQYRADAGVSNGANKFDIERAYITLRAPAGDRASIRITADVFQQTNTDNDAFYRGWVLRAKYAYLQYDALRGQSWRANLRAGLLQTVIIEHAESFWPRWLGPTPVERAGYFSSADAGIASTITFPNNRGELYATVTNGPGYTSRETDRFKDYAVRLTATPFRTSTVVALRGVAISAWHYQGTVGSKFASGGPGQLGPVGSGLARTRTGVFAGLQNTRAVIGVDYSRKHDEGERNSNTLASPRIVADSSGSLSSAFALLRLPVGPNGGTEPLRVFGRWDRFIPNRNASALNYTFVVAGLMYDVNKRVSASLDYQEQIPHGRLFVPVSKLYYLHLVANF